MISLMFNKQPEVQIFYKKVLLHRRKNRSGVLHYACYGVPYFWVKCKSGYGFCIDCDKVMSTHSCLYFYLI